MSAATPSLAGPHPADHEPTARLIHPADGCFAVVEVDIPAAIEDVWESVATGPGYRRWFVEAELEGRVGGRLITHHGDFGDSTGTITVWEPPHRYAYTEPDWMGDGTTVPDWITEITVHRLFPTEPAAGPGPGVGLRPGSGHDDGPAHTRVRLTSGVETEGERSGADIEGTLPGWRSALLLLGEYHSHFAGRQTAQALVMREVPAGRRLVRELGLDGAAVGQQATARGEAGGHGTDRTAVTGTVIQTTGGTAGDGPSQQESVVLRVQDGEEPGVYEFGTMQYGETRMSVVRGYLHLPAGAEQGVDGAANADAMANADAVAGAVERRWAAVLDGLLGT